MQLKGQTSMEFFLLFGLSMAILSVLFGAIDQRQSNVFKNHNAEIGREVASNVGFQTEMAMVQGEGYSRPFRLPGAIAGKNLTVNVENRTVYVGWGDKFVTEKTLYQNRTIEFNTNQTSTFRVLHNSTGVYVVEN